MQQSKKEELLCECTLAKRRTPAAHSSLVLDCAAPAEQEACFGKCPHTKTAHRHGPPKSSSNACSGRCRGGAGRGSQGTSIGKSKQPIQWARRTFAVHAGPMGKLGVRHLEHAAHLRSPDNDVEHADSLNAAV